MHVHNLVFLTNKATAATQQQLRCIQGTQWRNGIQFQVVFWLCGCLFDIEQAVGIVG